MDNKTKNASESKILHFANIKFKKILNLFYSKVNCSKISTIDTIG